jgi:hypothetical protein
MLTTPLFLDPEVSRSRDIKTELRALFENIIWYHVDFTFLEQHRRS